MAEITAMNAQITDAVTQVNVKTLGDSAANALSNLYQSNAHSVALSVQNANFGQQQTTMAHQATTTQGVNLLYAMDTAAIADGSTKIARADVPDNAITNVLISSLMSKKHPLSMDGIPPYLRDAVKQYVKNNSK